MIKAYLIKLTETSTRGDAREESYYPVLKDLLDEYCSSISKKNIHITPQPKKTEAGNPDFRVWDGKQHITGYIEAKDPTIENLDRIEETEQLKRYLHTFPNLILTNFLEFRLYRNGVLIDKALIGRPFWISKVKTTPPVEKESELLQIFEKFFSFSIPKVYDAKNLAIELAKRTRFLKDEVIAQELREEEETGQGFIKGFYEAFKEYLISGLKEDEFSDLYAQTITYGLFAARTRSENGFNRKLAYDNIPQTIGILRDVFQFVSLGSLPQQMEWIIDDISEILSVTDISKILHQYFHEGKGKDPIIHFYETFLTEYDPKTREMRGVYYTPEPVVSYIVRSLHSILKEQFNKPDGFADKNVTVLDPAAGTLTFLAETAKLAVDEFVSKYGEGGRKNFIKDHILKNFYAFELMMAPYAVGHLKMSFLLEELGYRLQKDDRVKLYLTNTLEMEELPETKLPGMASLSEESHLAGKVKKEQPILVILGNPPYSGHSSNIGEWISAEIKAYYQVDGKPLNEKNPKWLQDDYVKFLRFAQWKIDNVGEGILGFITNHGFIDNPTFRGMRQSLMNSFNKIYILNLHGDSGKKEKCPDGSKDENVFDITKGVSISLFVKERGKKENKVYFSEIWGARGTKYNWLTSNNIQSTKWKELIPRSKQYLFIPRDNQLATVYEAFIKINDIFPINNTGVITSRDKFVIDFAVEPLLNRVKHIQRLSAPEWLVRDTYKLRDVREKTLTQARKELAEVTNPSEYITKILYRPFDIRNIFYHSSLIRWPVFEVMRHMTKANIGLITARSNKSMSMDHFYCTEFIAETKSGESTTQSCLFPLYLYPNINKRDLFSNEGSYDDKVTNINPSILNLLKQAYNKNFTPEELFGYIYAVLYTPIFRKKYAEFLRLDFPRVPFTKDYKLFKKVSEYGNRLVDLHLLKSQELDSPIARFQGTGDNRVKKLKYNPTQPPLNIRGGEAGVTGRLYINKEQYFEGISQDVWSYQIGGYQVCDKWLKDRKDRVLSLDEIQTYCRIVTAIYMTIQIQKEIDKIYNEVEMSLNEA
jgi:predicted helicase